MEPFPAAINMTPALEMHAARVLPEKQIGFELPVTAIGRFPPYMRLSARLKLGLVGENSAVWEAQRPHRGSPGFTACASTVPAESMAPRPPRHAGVKP